MATSNNPTEILSDHLDLDLLPIGQYEAREDNDGFKTTYPQFASKQNDVDADTTFKTYFDPQTGAIVTIPTDSLNDLDEERQ